MTTFRALLVYPTWHLVTQFLVTGRCYEAGVDLACDLLACADRHPEVLPTPEEATARIAIYHLLLHMLDRLDAWDTYLDVWQQLRHRTAYTVHHSIDVATDPKAQPYVLRRAGNRFALHFLWYTDYRKQLIARKLAKHRGGGRVGNLRHHPQTNLSDAERRRRLAWVVRRERLLRWRGTETPPGTAADGSAPSAGRANRGVTYPTPAIPTIDLETFLLSLLPGEHGRGDLPAPDLGS